MEKKINADMVKQCLNDASEILELSLALVVVIMKIIATIKSGCGE